MSASSELPVVGVTAAAAAAAADSLEAKMGLLVAEYGLEACRKCLTQHASKETGDNGHESSSADRVIEGIIEASFDALFLINHEGIIQKVNGRALEEFGYESKSQLLGKSISMIVGHEHAAKHDTYVANFRQTGIKHVIGSMREVQGRRRDGSEFPIVLGIEVIQQDKMDEPLYVGFARDITQHKQDLANIQNEQLLNRAVVDASFHATFVTNDHGIIQKVNPSALKLFGYEEKEMVNHNIKMIMPDRYASHHDKWLETFRLTRVRHMIGTTREVQARRKDGSEFPCTLGLNCFDLRGDHEGEMMFVGFVRDLTKEKEAMALAIEKHAAEELLLNMLPEEVATRLKKDPNHIADHFTCATTLFADIVGFTALSSTLKPIEVVEFLNDIFTRFDRLVDRYGLNKVKTIGDCYMVTSIPGTLKDQPKTCTAMCHFGLDMIDALHEYNREHPERPLNLRVGINCGPVVAGVVGTKRFMYDIWGDAVNLASRMESTGVPGRIQVTEDVVKEVPAEEFVFERRGCVKVKGKGEMETLFLNGRVRPGVPYHMFVPEALLNGQSKKGLAATLEIVNAPPLSKH